MKSLLIVEDEQQQAWAYQVKLGRKYDVTVVENVDLAFAKLQTKAFDLILLDIMLPGGVNGFDFLKKIKSNPKTKDVPVMIVTNLDEDVKQTAMDLGAIDFVVKVSNTLEDIDKKISDYFESQNK